MSATPPIDFPARCQRACLWSQNWSRLGRSDPFDPYLTPSNLAQRRQNERQGAHHNPRVRGSSPCSGIRNHQLSAAQPPESGIGLTSMAGGGAGVEGRSGLGHESPFVAVGMQRQRQDAERVDDADLAVGPHGA
jgi:hypothetical protein